MPPYNPLDLPDMADTGHRYPVIVRDTRDNANPLVFPRLKSVWGTMKQGDYSAVGFERVLSFERKKLGDLAHCSGADWFRFANEFDRLRGYQCAALMIQGKLADLEAGIYHSKTTPQSILARLDSILVMYRVPTYFFDTADEMARRIEVLACRFARGWAKQGKAVELVELAGIEIRDGVTK